MKRKKSFEMDLIYLPKDCLLVISEKIEEFKDWNYLRSTCRFFRNLLCFEIVWKRWGKIFYFDYFPMPKSFIDFNQHLKFDKCIEKFDKMYCHDSYSKSLPPEYLFVNGEKKPEESTNYLICAKLYKANDDYIIQAMNNGFFLFNKKTRKVDKAIITTLEENDQWTCTNSYIFVLTEDGRSRIHPFDQSPTIFDPLPKNYVSVLSKDYTVIPSLSLSFDGPDKLVFFNELSFDSKGKLSESTFITISVPMLCNSFPLYADRDLMILKYQMIFQFYVFHSEKIRKPLFSNPSQENLRLTELIKRIGNRIFCCVYEDFVLNKSVLSKNWHLVRFDISGNDLIYLDTFQLTQGWTSVDIKSCTIFSHYFFSVNSGNLSRVDLLTGIKKDISVPAHKNLICNFYSRLIVRSSVPFDDREIYAFD